MIDSPSNDQYLKPAPGENRTQEVASFGIHTAAQRATGSQPIGAGQDQIAGVQFPVKRTVDRGLIESLISIALRDEEIVDQIREAIKLNNKDRVFELAARLVGHA